MMIKKFEEAIKNHWIINHDVELTEIIKSVLIGEEVIISISNPYESSTLNPFFSTNIFFEDSVPDIKEVKKIKRGDIVYLYDCKITRILFRGVILDTSEGYIEENRPPDDGKIYEWLGMPEYKRGIIKIKITEIYDKEKNENLTFEKLKKYGKFNEKKFYIAQLKETTTEYIESIVL